MLPDYIEEAGNVTIAMDNMVVDIDDLRITGKLIPVLRTAFASEINELNQRLLKKRLHDDELAALSGETINSKQKRKEISDQTINHTFASKL